MFQWWDSQCQNESMKQVLCVCLSASGSKKKKKTSCHESVFTAPNDTTAQSKSKNQTQDLWSKKIKQNWQHLHSWCWYDVPTQAQTCELQSHHGLWQRQKKYIYKKMTIKTAHIKAKEHTVTPPYVQTCACMDTNSHTEGQIYIKCTLFFWAKHET